LQVLKQIYVAETTGEAGPVRVSVTTQVALGLMAAAVILLGCAPGLLVERLAALVLLIGPA
jgi:hypothetical protein